jgi:hypothetical protein
MQLECVDLDIGHEGGHVCGGHQKGVGLSLSALLTRVRVIKGRRSGRLTALVPNPLLAHAAAQGPATFYSCSTLYEYIDGAADVFQGYDVEVVLHQEFKAGVGELTVDIFGMGSLENAFGMYASERSPKYDFVDAGAEGYRNEGILNFFQDRYYVKIAGFGSGADAAIAQFAAGISRNIGSNKNFPALVSKLPEAGRNRHPELYLRKDPLGHPF